MTLTIDYRSMYIDEDGDVAHEFYIETKEGSKVTMKKISNQYLTPQVSFFFNFLIINFLSILILFKI